MTVPDWQLCSNFGSTEPRYNNLLTKQKYEKNKYIDSLLAEISKNVEVDIPEEMVDDEIHHMIHRFEDQLKMQGISLDMYYQFTGSDENMLHSQMEKEAYEHILYRLTLEEIMKLSLIHI